MRCLRLPAAIPEALAKSGDYLTVTRARKRVHAFVTSLLDVNNALLAGLPDDTVAKLQECQKSTIRWGARAFSKVAPVLWNTLPATIKTAHSLASFKLGLKTYLFKAASYVNNACQYFIFIYLNVFYLTFILHFLPIIINILSYRAIGKWASQ